MATTLYLPTGAVPTNLHLREGINTRFVENDLYDICRRMEKISRRLYAVEMEDGTKIKYAIMEHCDDGIDRLVFRVDQLDGRVLHRLEQLMAMSLQARLDQIERDEYKFEAERKEAELEDLYERVGAPMWTELEKANFIQRPVSYPKTGVTGGKGSRAKAA